MRAIVAALSGLPLWLAAAQAQPAAPIRATYEIYAMGLPVAELRTTFTIGERDYRIDIAYETTGLIGALFRGRQVSSVQGAWIGDRPVPLRFSGDGFWHGEARRVVIDYQRSTPLIRVLSPPPADREPVPPALQVGTMDTLSAMALLIRHVARTGSCEARAETFDGLRLADIAAHTAGRETIPASSRSSYSGPALRCDFDGRLQAGFLRDDDRAEAARPQHGSAWLAPAVPGGPPIPVQLTFETRWSGQATMYLTGASAVLETAQKPAQ
jgi:hypothetical protein